MTKIEKGMLKWFGHVERMSDSRLTKGIYKADVSGITGSAALGGHTLTLLVGFFRKVRCVVLAIGVRV